MAIPTDLPPGISVRSSATSTSTVLTGSTPSSRKIRFAEPLCSPAWISSAPSPRRSVAWVSPASKSTLPGSLMSSTALEPAVSESVSGNSP